MSRNTLPKRWWMQYPKREKLQPKDHPTYEKPRLVIGDKVRIRLKPDLQRKVIDARPDWIWFMSAPNQAMISS